MTNYQNQKYRYESALREPTEMEWLLLFGEINDKDVFNILSESVYSKVAITIDKFRIKLIDDLKNGTR